MPDIPFEIQQIDREINEKDRLTYYLNAEKLDNKMELFRKELSSWADKYNYYQSFVDTLLGFVEYNKADGKTIFAITTLLEHRSDRDPEDYRISQDKYDYLIGLIDAAFKKDIGFAGFMEYRLDLFVVPDECIKDIEFVKNYIRESNCSGIYEIMPNEFKEDRELSLLVAKNSGKYFQMVPEKYQNDKHFVIEAVKAHSSTLEFVPEHFKDDKDVILASLTKESLDFELVEFPEPSMNWALEHASDRFKKICEGVSDFEMQRKLIEAYFFKEELNGELSSDVKKTKKNKI